MVVKPAQRKIKFTVVCVRKDEEHNAWLVKAEGKMGARISWFSDEKPSYAVGDEFGVIFQER